MNSLVALICKIGIFMIAAQAVIHFAPAQKYAKYMKLVVGIMVLLQFLTPMYNILGDAGEDWNTRLSDIGAELDAGLLGVEIAEGDSVTKSIVRSIEKEIKSRLNSEIAGEGYSVIKVDVDIKDADEMGMGYNYDYNYNNNDSYEKHELDMVRVVVSAYTAGGKMGVEGTDGNIDGSNEVKVGKISIPRIDIGEDGAKQQEADRRDYGKAQNAASRLRERFCNVLGIEEQYMEVIVYGEAE